MKFLSMNEFSALSDTDKNNYLEELRCEKNNVFTADDFERLAAEAGKLNYGNSSEIANEFHLQAEIQREADRKYNAEKRKRGFAVIFAVICATVLVVSVGTIIAMFFN